MELRQFIIDSWTGTREGTLRATKGITQSQAVWQPAPEANSIAFLLWHIARSEDSLVNLRVAKDVECWSAQGWDKKIALPAPKPVGEWTTAELGKFKPALPEVFGYMSAVRECSLSVMAKFDMSRLGEHPMPARPEWTIATILQLVSRHEAHHQGAIEYLVGLAKAKGVK